MSSPAAYSLQLFSSLLPPAGLRCHSFPSPWWRHYCAICGPAHADRLCTRARRHAKPAYPPNRSKLRQHSGLRFYSQGLRNSRSQLRRLQRCFFGPSGSYASPFGRFSHQVHATHRMLRNTLFSGVRLVHIALLVCYGPRLASRFGSILSYTQLPPPFDLRCACPTALQAYDVKAQPPRR